MSRPDFTRSLPLHPTHEGSTAEPTIPINIPAVFQGIVAGTLLTVGLEVALWGALIDYFLSLYER